MKYHFVLYAIRLLLSSLCCIAMTRAYGQSDVQLDVPETFEKTKDPISGGVIRILNKSDRSFSGILNIHFPAYVRAISVATIDVQLYPTDSLFVPVKFYLPNNIPAGESAIVYELSDNKNRALIVRAESRLHMKHVVALQLVNNQDNIFHSNPADSVRLSVTVRNAGNTNERTNVIFSIPALYGQKNFFPLPEVLIPAGGQQVFNFSYMPTAALLEQDNYTVNVSALHGNEKNPIGNRNILIQNIKSSRSYHTIQSVVSGDESLNKGISLSYRQTGSNSKMYQIAGGGSFDLPVGYLSLSGQLYTFDKNPTVIGTNTRLSYHYRDNILQIGNIVKNSDANLYGRGIELQLGDKSEKSVQIGFIDQQFNLFANHPFLQNGYSAYITGMLPKLSSHVKQVEATYIYKHEPYEQADHQYLQMSGLWNINRDWTVQSKLTPTFSTYSILNIHAPSLASELGYQGRIKRLVLNGNYFYSTPYFPGNRRGMLLLQQGWNIRTSSNYAFRGSFMMNQYQPKIFLSNYSFNSRILSGNVAVDFPTNERWRFGLNYTAQHERSNSYSSLLTGMPDYSPLSLTSQRINEQVSWRKDNHNISLAFEQGLSWTLENKKPLGQFVGRLGYGYNWLNISGSYQYGSQSVSEYVYAQNKGKNSFNRLYLTTYASPKFPKANLQLDWGSSYTVDDMIGSNLGLYGNLKYSPAKRWTLYCNSSWYQYKYANFNQSATLSSVFNMELGVRFNFQKSTPSALKKGNLKLFVFFDNNNNRIFDEGDTPASGYPIIFNKIAFISDASGYITYNKLPFGSYSLESGAKQGWFNEAMFYNVHKHNDKLYIPLYQTGTVNGQLKYQFDKLTDVEYKPKFSGVSFTIKSEESGQIYRAVTTESGSFTVFLPAGDYTITLNNNSLPANSVYKAEPQRFSVKAGKNISLPPFHIGVRPRTVNIKKFSQ